MSAQADINDYMNAQVTGTEIFMEYDHQKMLDEIDANNVLLGSVTAPVITSGATGTNLVENIGADQPVYTITATATWPAPTYAIGGTDFDAGSLSLNVSTGVVTLTVDPDYEQKSSYSFNVTAIDAANNTSAATTVTFSITNVDEDIPTITSGATGIDLAENSGAGQTIYTITADANDGGTIQSFAIGGSDFDANLLSVNASTGIVTLTADPDYETQSSYSFTVTASDAAGTSNASTVTFSITDVVESLAFVNCGDPYTYENHSYATVLIGTQCWFAENLRNENYNTGAPITTGLSDDAWGTNTDGAVCVYDEGSYSEAGILATAAILATYGRLYNGYAVSTGNLCPSGWHVPTDGEYTTLTDGLGGTSVAGGKMKSSASDSPAWNGTNTSGFSGLAGGGRVPSGVFVNGDDDSTPDGYFWSASASASTYGASAWYRKLNGSTTVYRQSGFLQNGMSVRCIQD